VAFERALQAADKALGGDGLIALPYWDVLTQPELNSQVVPRLLRQHFPNDKRTVRKLLANPRTTAGSDGDRQQEKRVELWREGFKIKRDRYLKNQVET